jgi:hypothetical protein
MVRATAGIAYPLNFFTRFGLPDAAGLRTMGDLPLYVTEAGIGHRLVVPQS